MYNDRKIRAMNKIGGAVCRRCGCTELSFLEFNHKNGGGCKEFKTNHKSMAEKILFDNRRTDDLEVLCRVCNALDYLQRKSGEANRYLIMWK